MDVMVLLRLETTGEIKIELVKGKGLMCEHDDGVNNWNFSATEDYKLM